MSLFLSIDLVNFVCFISTFLVIRVRWQTFQIWVVHLFFFINPVRFAFCFNGFFIRMRFVDDHVSLRARSFSAAPHIRESYILYKRCQLPVHVILILEKQLGQRVI